MEKTNQKSKIKPKKHLDTFVNMAKILNGQEKFNSKPFLEELKLKQESFQKHGYDELCFKGIKTDFIDLDKMIMGLENSQLVILGSRPSMGKTALALNIVENICFKQGLSVGIFSFEMSAEQLSHRMICSLAEVESEKIKSGALNGVDFQRLANANNIIQKSTLLIDNNPGGLPITDIRERAHQMKDQFNVQMIIIDYLQLITTSSSHLPCENRAHDLSEITRILKYLSKELDIPIICLSQLSRKVEERQGHRPMMSDIRDCGAIEDHADVIMFLLRREYYDPMDKPGMAELIIAKNRHGGAKGSINMMYYKEFVKFVNYTPHLLQESQESYEHFNQENYYHFNID